MTTMPFLLWRAPYVVALLALLLTVASFLLSYPGLVGWTNRVPLAAVVHEEGYRWSAPLPEGVAPPRGRRFLLPDRARVLENGIALPGPVASEKHIANGGWGRFRIDREKVLLSTSDDAGTDGRRYDLETGAFDVPENALLVLWVVTFMLWVWAVRCGWRLPHILPTTLLVAGFGILWALGLLIRPVYWSGQFFDTLWLPVLWSCGVSALAARTSPPALIGLLTFSQIPAVTSYLHYAVGGASHPSFLVVGAVPWSDAWVHFHQAVQIALSGVTDHAFNGRFFYPLVLATAIWFAGWNLQLALALLLGLSLGAVALLARVIRPEAGWAGTSLFVLGCALYLRAHVAGLCMTESLGFLAGALGTACLLTGAAWRSPRWFFAGLFCVALGMAARPGALLVLPALGICAALVFGWRSAARMVLLLALSAVVVVAPFAANASLGHFVSSDSSKPFNNFAFSLHGMLLGEGWEESAAQTEHNPAVAIQRSKELLLAKPWLILSGYQRAWGYLAGKNFLFRFGQERRLAATMNLLAGLGLIGIWFLPGLRPQALWITLAAGGLILSLPLAPPWDASERPFAVTVPMQCLCAAVGLAWISAGVRRCARWPTALPRAETGLVIKPWTGALAAFALALSLVALLRAWMLFPSAGSQSWPPDFRHGSSRTIDNVREYRESLAFFLAGQGDKARDFSRIGEVAILAVDWGSLTTMAVRSPISSTQPKFVETDWVVLDPAILDAQTGAKQEQ